MTTPTPYQQLQAERAAKPGPDPRKPRRPKYPPEVAKARAAERTRRTMEGRRRASMVLIARHQDEYDTLFAAESAEIHRARGPLPGDEQ